MQSSQTHFHDELIDCIKNGLYFNPINKFKMYEIIGLKDIHLLWIFKRF